MWQGTHGLRFWPCLTAILAMAAILQVMLTPCLTLSAGGRRLAIYEAGPGLHLTVDFIHSVQKTPVREILAVERGGKSLELLETRYRSFGVGLPFLAEEGDFLQEGDEFVLRGMQRHFPALSLRTGLGTRLVLTAAGPGVHRVWRLFEAYEPGTRIDLAFEPLYKILLSF